MSPVSFVLPEVQLQTFKWYAQGHSHTAVLFRNGVYVQLKRFRPQQRLAAYQLCEDINALTQVLMTVSETGYRLWVEQPAWTKVQATLAAAVQ